MSAASIAQPTYELQARPRRIDRADLDVDQLGREADAPDNILGEIVETPEVFFGQAIQIRPLSGIFGSSLASIAVTVLRVFANASAQSKVAARASR